MGLLKCTFALKYIFALILMAKLSHCVDIECEFRNHTITSDWGERYSCITKKYVIKPDDRLVKTVTGLHLKNHTSANVTQYYARNLSVERFPIGLGEKFANLEVVRFTFCGMRLLFKESMQNLTKLKYLDLINNKIEKLNSDVFELAPNLVEVVLNNNRLKFIGSFILEPLTKLKFISFGGNVCLSSHFKYAHEQLPWLKREIMLQCSDISMADVMKRFDEIDAKLDLFWEFFVRRNSIENKKKAK